LSINFHITNEKIKFSKRVFEGGWGNFSQVKKVSPKISDFH